MQHGPLFVLSGASGSGKSTLVAELLRQSAWPLRVAVSATTRPPRPGEVDGRDYHFWTRDRFLAAVAAGEFLEHAEVHGNLYGTLASEVVPYRQMGRGVFVVIDVQGAARLRQIDPYVITIFVQVGTLAVIEQRLRARGTEDEPTIQRRLANAQIEVAQAGEYEFEVVNDDLPSAVRQLEAIVATGFQRVRACSTN
jgi:guanylate kinase